LYAGRAGGTFHNHKGGAANYLCMPDDPDYLHYRSGVQGYNPVYGAEYETFGHPLSAVNNHNVPCAVCYASTRAAVTMIPAKTRPSTWTLEYSGYLMSDYKDYHTTMYECVDKNPDSVPGSAANTNRALFHHVEAQCTRATYIGINSIWRHSVKYALDCLAVLCGSLSALLLWDIVHVREARGRCCPAILSGGVCSVEENSSTYFRFSVEVIFQIVRTGLLANQDSLWNINAWHWLVLHINTLPHESREAQETWHNGQLASFTVNTCFFAPRWLYIYHITYLVLMLLNTEYLAAWPCPA